MIALPARLIGFRLMILWCLAFPCAIPALARSAAPPIGAGADGLFGDRGGPQTLLRRYGVTLKLSETGEVLGNLTGGIRRGFDYDGLTKIKLVLHTRKAFEWRGGKLKVSALQIHGRNLSTDNLATIQTASGIEADRATRLWELWYRQAVLNGTADLKFGQQSVDNEFIVSRYAGLFVNTMMGWPVVPSLDLYAGGPAYPLSSLGVRLRAKPTRRLTILAGVFDDNPPGGPFFNDSQLRDGEASGTRFNLGTGALFLGELQYRTAYPPFAGRLSKLPGTYKLGLWVDTGHFPDQRFDAAGLSLAAPASSGVARLHRGNFSLYGVADQRIWQPDPKAARSLAVFARLMGAPGDRNLIDFGVNAGITVKAPLPGRAHDRFGIGYGLAKVSGRASALDRDRVFFTGIPFPVRSNEQFVEVTYRWQVARWLAVQPDFQYVFNPGAGAGNPDDPTHRIGDEAIIGVRTRIAF
jgi:porin